jgi:hypothetical protein
VFKEIVRLRSSVVNCFATEAFLFAHAEALSHVLRYIPSFKINIFIVGNNICVAKNVTTICLLSPVQSPTCQIDDSWSGPEISRLPRNWSAHYHVPKNPWALQSTSQHYGYILISSSHLLCLTSGSFSFPGKTNHNTPTLGVFLRVYLEIWKGFSDALVLAVFRYTRACSFPIKACLLFSTGIHRENEVAIRRKSDVIYLYSESALPSLVSRHF